MQMAKLDDDDGFTKVFRERQQRGHKD